EGILRGSPPHAQPRGATSITVVRDTVVAPIGPARPPGPARNGASVTGRLAIDDVQPSIDGGRYPTKAVVGEVVPVSAVVWREGHDAIAATLAVRGPADDPESAGRLVRIPMVPGTEPDTFHATFSPTSVGAWTYRVEAWSDPVATWRHAVTAKTDAGQDAAELANDLEVGARIFEKAAKGAPRGNRPALLAVAASLRSDRPLA